MGLGDAAGRALLPAVDKVVSLRYEPAQAAVVKLREAQPDLSAPQVADVLIRRYRKELGALGAAVGGAAAAPGIGLVSGTVASATEVSYTAARLGEMILSIGAAYGHAAEDIEQRRAWVLAVLGVALGANSGVAGLAEGVGAKGGVKIVKAIPQPVIQKINTRLGGRVIVKWGTTQGVVRLGSLVPFGVGAGIGLAGNAVLVQAVGNRAKSFFDDGTAAGAPVGDPPPVEGSATELPPQ